MGKPKLTREEVMERFKNRHGDKYNYSEIKSFKNIKEPQRIFCPIHGFFEQSIKKHFKYGCNECAIEYRKISTRRTLEEFIKLSGPKHKFKYDYNKTNYINSYTKIIIICPIHGEFYQTPKEHLKGAGCSRCIRKISLDETKWLDQFNIPEEYRYYKIKISEKIYFFVDGFDPKTNTVYEFNGDYWHGNPKKYNSNDFNKKVNKTFGELYQYTLEKEKILKEAGYTVISIWESNFRKSQE